MRLITEAGVALTPGSCFGGEGHVRISCCQSMENLQEALDRMEMWLKQISRPA
ncbi:MAG: aminotransferase class I/II-fold pyridoxal phosphate-dependent enzyme [Emergencia sp.]